MNGFDSREQRTVLSSAIVILADPTYNFEIERKIGVDGHSEDEIISILAEIGGVKPMSITSIARRNKSPVGILHLFILVFL